MRTLSHKCAPHNIKRTDNVIGYRSWQPSGALYDGIKGTCSTLIPESVEGSLQYMANCAIHVKHVVGVLHVYYMYLLHMYYTCIPTHVMYV